MKNFIVSILVLGLAACSAPESDSSTNVESRPQPVGGDRDAYGCIPSAGYQWSEAKQECVRIWEVAVILRHQGSGDPDYSASVIQGEDKAEVIIAPENKRVILVRTGDRSEGYVWSNDQEDLVLIMDGDGHLQLQDGSGFVMYAQDNVVEPGYDDIPDHSYDEVGGEIVQARGIVKRVEDGPYPQFTLHIDLQSKKDTTLFNLIAEGAELNGADLGALEGKTVSLEYVIREKFDLMDIGLKGSEIIENMEGQDGWYFTEGLLEGADTISGGDLPDVVTIWENGGAVTFESFIGPDLVELNNKEVGAWLDAGIVNDILYLKVEN